MYEHAHFNPPKQSLIDLHVSNAASVAASADLPSLTVADSTSRAPKIAAERMMKTLILKLYLRELIWA